jgi:HSP20 family protein
MFNLQREADRLFNQFWSELPIQSAASPSFQVHSTDDAWRIDVPLPGIDPKHVNLEIAGNTLSIRAEESEGEQGPAARYAQTFTVPQFLDLEKVSASHRHGLLQLTIPLKDTVKPRRIQIDVAADQRQLTAA